MAGGGHENMREWTPKEDVALMNLVNECRGNHWTKIQPNFPDRSISSIRNRWQRISRTNFKKPPKQRCRYCGAFRRGHVCLMSTETDVPETPPLKHAQPFTPRILPYSLTACQGVIVNEAVVPVPAEVPVEDAVEVYVPVDVPVWEFAINEDVPSSDTTFLAVAARLSHIAQ